MKFYTYRQTNSGGEFIVNEKLSQFVIIEANSHVEANAKAEEVGIYFNGCITGEDCSCCGDRWEELDEYDIGTETPEIHGKKPSEYISYSPFNYEYRIHFVNGNIESGGIRKEEYKFNQSR